MDVFESSAKILSLAASGVSRVRIMAMNQQLRQDEATWLLKMLLDRNLLEIDSSAAYWTTADGVKFLEIQFHMERILQGQKSLV